MCLKPDERDERIKKAEALLIEDGWKKLNREINGVCLIHTGYSILLKFVEWDSDWDEFKWITRWYPVFKEHEDEEYPDDESMYSDIFMLAADSMPKMTDKTKEANELLKEYFEEQESKYVEYALLNVGSEVE